MKKHSAIFIFLAFALFVSCSSSHSSNDSDILPDTDTNSQDSETVDDDSDTQEAEIVDDYDENLIKTMIPTRKNPIPTNACRL